MHNFVLLLEKQKHCLKQNPKDTERIKRTRFSLGRQLYVISCKDAQIYFQGDQISVARVTRQKICCHGNQSASYQLIFDSFIDCKPRFSIMENDFKIYNSLFQFYFSIQKDDHNIANLWFSVQFHSTGGGGGEVIVSFALSAFEFSKYE